MATSPVKRSIVNLVRQSPPVDLTQSYDADWVAGKTIVITGGAAGFGEGFFRKWASHGANVIIGDIDDKRGEELVAEIRSSTKNDNHHYLHCDVTDWQSQVDFFKQAEKLSLTGGIDSVVANAGVSDNSGFQEPGDMTVDSPIKPDLLCVNVNLIGVIYTTHLALFYLPRNPNSKAASPSSQPGQAPDRHILLIGSIASLCPVPGQNLYAVAKHGVLGLFRSLRATSFAQGVRVNLLCPYFMDTAIVPTGGRLLLAGGVLGQTSDVVDAGTRLMADTRIVGRALAVGPKVKTALDDEWQLVSQEKDGREVAIWEVNAEDYENVDVFTARFVGLINRVEQIRGWLGWGRDLWKAFLYSRGGN